MHTVISKFLFIKFLPFVLPINTIALLDLFFLQQKERDLDNGAGGNFNSGGGGGDAASGGTSNAGGDGGNLGQNGQDTAGGGSAGSSGTAIDGWSYRVGQSGNNDGDIRGPKVN